MAHTDMPVSSAGSDTDMDFSSAGKSIFPLVGCGILKKEITFLIRKNNWPVTPHFLCSSLHIDFEKLEKTLVKALQRRGQGPKAVIYGTCHPTMDDFLRQGNAVRTPGQNCVEHLLGKTAFTRHLSAGAFFLMEEWSHRWELITGLTFGDSPEVIREIFSMEHTHLLAVKTPCSGDFEKEAIHISQLLDLPLKWLSISLEHLEKNLMDTFSRVQDMIHETRV